MGPHRAVSLSGIPAEQASTEVFRILSTLEYRITRNLGWIFISTLLSFSLGCGASGGNSGGSPPPPPPPQTTYTISGTVTGLVGRIQLQNNGAELRTLSSNGTFSFRKPVSRGGTYEVTISAEPIDPVQFCVVSNGKGTAYADVTNVLVACTTPTKQTVYNFGQGDDSFPQGALMFDSSGNLYGTTSGGDYGNGSVFKLTPNDGQWLETVLYTFCHLPGCVDGRNPGSGVIWDAAGNLYGTTNRGGAYGQGGTTGGGTVFELSPNEDGTWTETVLHSFGNGTDGAGLFISGLVFDNAGNLYGTTSAGGNIEACSLGCGTVFELSPDSVAGWTERVIYAFCSGSASGSHCSDGAFPLGGVAFDSLGNLYGTTRIGGHDFQGGTVFELSPSNGAQWTEKVLYAFQGVDGANPRSGVVLDSAGNLYGTTEFGYQAVGINNGVVFELIRGDGGQWQERILYGFCASPNYCADGSTPEAPLVFDKAGNLYGTGWMGGLFQTYGVVFALTPGPSSGLWAQAPLYSFQGGLDGGNPSFGLVMDEQGTLYGTAGGGTDGKGIVFAVIP